MNEKRVSVQRETFELPEPFVVIATQNPTDFRGDLPTSREPVGSFHGQTTARLS